MNTSSGRGFTTCCPDASVTARMSRWQCTVALAWPVVPEVNAMIAGSSADVRTVANRGGCAVSLASSESGAALLKRSDRADGRAANAVSRSDATLASVSARRTSARSMISVSSRGRSSGMVVTATAPALRTASQHATSIGWFGARSRTRSPARGRARRRGRGRCGSRRRRAGGTTSLPRHGERRCDRRRPAESTRRAKPRSSSASQDTGDPARPTTPSAARLREAAGDPGRSDRRRRRARQSPSKVTGSLAANAR